MSFPAAPVLDTFTRANENPLAGSWAQLSTSSSALQLTGNQVTGAAGQIAGSYWTATTGTDIEAWATVATLGAAFEYVRVLARVRQEGGADTWDGYGISYITSTADLELVKYTDATAVAILGVQHSFTLSAGEKLGIRCSGTDIQGWVFQNGVWSMSLSNTDSTYASGKIGLQMNNATYRVDDFGGGSTTIPIAWSYTL